MINMSILVGDEYFSHRVRKLVVLLAQYAEELQVYAGEDDG